MFSRIPLSAQGVKLGPKRRLHEGAAPDLLYTLREMGMREHTYPHTPHPTAAQHFAGLHVPWPVWGSTRPALLWLPARPPPAPQLLSQEPVEWHESGHQRISFSRRSLASLEMETKCEANVDSTYPLCSSPDSHICLCYLAPVHLSFLTVCPIDFSPKHRSNSLLTL
jgi:hypothetical protein